MDIFIGM